jgi:hypothetical protein
MIQIYKEALREKHRERNSAKQKDSNKEKIQAQRE